MSSPEPRRFGVLVPVKRPAVAKSRLAGLGDGRRQQLAGAFARDTVRAALACPVVEVVLAVTDDHRLARGLADLGAHVVPDGTEDLNGSLVQAAAELARRWPHLGLAALCADLPALRPAELASALGGAPADAAGFVPDADGTGTTLLVAPDLARFRPAFGPGSSAAHRDLGAVPLATAGMPSLRRDVDTPDDLADAARLGVGTDTAAWLPGPTI